MTLIYLTLAWCAGIVLVRLSSGLSPLVALLGALAGVGLAIAQRRNRTWRVAWLCLAAAALGTLRMMAASAPPGPASLASYNGRGWRTFEGIIVAEPDVRDTHVNLRVAVNRMNHYQETAAIHGTALIQAPRYGDYAYGDRILFGGEPLTPPEFDDFSYRDYLARQGVYSLVYNAEVNILSHDNGSRFTGALLALNRRGRDLIADILPEPQASLLTGILLGVETGISPDVRDAFNATGTSHVIAISGFNMTILAALLSRMLTLIMPRRRRLAFLISATAIGVYTLFVGSDPSVVRAAIMSILLIAAPLFRRKTYTPASLALAALLMSLDDPFVLWDVGFQLSFASVLGLALFVSPLDRLLQRGLNRFLSQERAERLAQLLGEPVVVTLAAQIATLPLIGFYFGRFSTLSLLVNFLILPVQPLILFLGGAATLTGLLAAGLAVPLYWATWVFLAWTTGVVRFFATLPGASLPLQIDGGMALVFYGGMLLVTVLQGTQPNWPARLKNALSVRRTAVLVLGAGAITAALLWIAALNLPDGRLHVFFLDMGHSNAVLIRTPGGSTVLVDGGQYPTRLLTALGDHLPFWERDLALLVLTQPKPAQVTALPAVLERYRVAQILTNGQQPASETVLALYQTAADQHIPVQAVIHGYTAEISDGVRLEVLYPFEPPAPDSKPEEAGLVLRLTYGEASFLLTPDLDPSVEQALLHRGIALHGTVLELASHGSGRVSGEPFLTAVSPQVAVVQVEPGNRSGLPAPEVVDRLGAVPLFRTDTMSEIAITTDGRTLWIDTARQP